MSGLSGRDFGWIAVRDITAPSATRYGYGVGRGGASERVPLRAAPQASAPAVTIREAAIRKWNAWPSWPLSFSGTVGGQAVSGKIASGDQLLPFGHAPTPGRYAMHIDHDPHPCPFTVDPEGCGRCPDEAGCAHVAVLRALLENDHLNYLGYATWTAGKITTREVVPGGELVGPPAAFSLQKGASDLDWPYRLLLHVNGRTLVWFAPGNHPGETGVCPTTDPTCPRSVLAQEVVGRDFWSELASTDKLREWRPTTRASTERVRLQYRCYPDMALAVMHSVDETRSAPNRRLPLTSGTRLLALMVNGRTCDDLWVDHDRRTCSHCADWDGCPHRRVLRLLAGSPLQQLRETLLGRIPGL